MNVQILAPLAIRDAANVLAACKAPAGPPELRSFPPPQFTSALRGPVSIAETNVSAEWIAGMTQPVVEPEWMQGQYDIAAAQAVLDGAVILTSLPDDPNTIPTDRLIVYFGTGLPQFLGLELA